jgi:hypothetical protein
MRLADRRLARSLFIVAVGIVDLTKANVKTESSKPLDIPLHKLVSYLSSLGHSFYNADDLSATIVYTAKSIRFTTDLSSNRDAISAKAKELGQPLTSKCALFIPTYFVHVEDDAIAESFNSSSNFTVFSVSPGDTYSIVSGITSASENNRSTRSSTRSIADGRRLVDLKGKLWSHIEKNGGSFSTTAENLKYNWIAHTPPPVGGCKGVCRVISLFREPGQRLESWHYFSKFAKWCTERLPPASHPDHASSAALCFDWQVQMFLVSPEGTPNKQVLRRFGSNAYLTSGLGLTQWGCQSKHVMGYPCSQNILKLPSELRTAHGLAEHAVCRLREDYDAIGLTDDFDASVTLSHQKLGGQLDLNSGFIRMNTREQVGKFKTMLGAHSYGPNSMATPIASTSPCYRYSECDRNTDCVNPPDDALFEEVQRIMLRGILLHHNKVVRVVDTAEFADKLAVPKETN